MLIELKFRNYNNQCFAWCPQFGLTVAAETEIEARKKIVKIIERLVALSAGSISDSVYFEFMR